MTTIVAIDFNLNVKDNYNAELVDCMKDSLEHDSLWDLCQGTTTSDS
jgi:hypothetical protein